MPLFALPQALRRTLDRLESAGLETWLVGRCVRELLRGETPLDYECVCLGGAGEVLEALPRAVVTERRDRVVTAPGEDGPLDVRPADDATLGSVLAQRDFTLHAIAYREKDEQIEDPHDGRADLAAGVLRTPGAAKDRLAEDPLRALRALRLVAEHGFELDPDLEAALPGQAEPLAALGGRRVRVELERLLLGPHAERALVILRDTGLERALAPGVRPDAAAVVARLPFDLGLRLAAWLRGARVRTVMRDLRGPRDRALQIERLLQLHPVDAGTAATREARVRRLARRDADLRARLLALREAEIRVSDDPDERRSFERLRRSLDAIERAARVAEQRATLALGGREIMEALGCGPGATVGRALRFLSERVAEDPSLNEPASLLRLLEAFEAEPRTREEETR